MRTGILMLLMVALTACAQSPLRPLQSMNQHTNSQTALVAFSVVSEEPFPLRKLTLERASGGAKILKSPRLHVQPGNPGGQLFLYEVPAAGAQFGIATFKKKRFIWQTTSFGPSFTPLPGYITYLGRIKVSALRFRMSDVEQKQIPIAVKIAVTDASAEDLVLLLSSYRIPPDVKLLTAIPTMWGDKEFTDLRYVSKYAESSLTTDGIMGFGGMQPVGPELPANSGPQN